MLFIANCAINGLKKNVMIPSASFANNDQTSHQKMKMNKKIKLTELKAKKLIGKNVRITLKKISDSHCPSHTVDVKLINVKQGCVTFVKSTGMEYTYSIKDEYFEIENIEENESI